MIKSNFSLQEIAKNRILKNKNELSETKSYKSACKNLGAMIIQNGLYGTLLFYKGKANKSNSKSHYLAIYNDLIEFIKSQNIVNNNGDILKELEKTDKLHIIQDRVLEIINWYRRYADVFIEGGE
jgi:CRISPR-associated protein Cmr5